MVFSTYNVSLCKSDANINVIKLCTSKNIQMNTLKTQLVCVFFLMLVEAKGGGGGGMTETIQRVRLSIPNTPHTLLPAFIRKCKHLPRPQALAHRTTHYTNSLQEVLSSLTFILFELNIPTASPFG